ncbi:MAG: DUF4268 domain-containing protein [Bilifractor sp.]
MKGSEAQLLAFMEGASNKYIIPVYQRKYDWKTDNCRQLYTDLVKIIKNGRSSHFFGSIVSQVVPAGAKIEYHIIDGQQRLTTVTLLLLAISNMLHKKRVQSQEDKLDEQIMERFVIAKWAKDDERIKLRPVKSDRSALEKLVAGDAEEYENDSNLTINYKFFCDQILRSEVSVDELYDAINKLQIISITLDPDDDAQLIFESLNSTGLALTEGDKIRNYILMGLSPKKQEEYYDNFWTKIEQCTHDNVSTFVRDYLSIKQQVTPTISNVYQAFKKYVEENDVPLDALLEDLKKYARFYERLISGKSGLGIKGLDGCMDRLNRLEITVTEPFFMEVLRLCQDGKISSDEVTRIFLITEDYLFRRNICEVPTNALNKIFLNLNKEIIRYDNTTNGYVDKFIYALLSKKESGRFPTNEEFAEALTYKQVYQMRGKYKAYLFERFENHDTKETKDVYQHLDDGTYSIEHIMPQHLTPAWRESLGPDAEEIHTNWLHRLGNLTLTAYNPDMSNSTFAEKRDNEHGYKNSGIRMNQKIAMKETWGLKEMQERSNDLVKEAVTTIWPMPETQFVPAKKEFDSCSLDDEEFDLKGREIVKYSYRNKETPVTSWADMFEHVVKYLHSQDKSVLTTLAYSTSSTTDFATYFSSDGSTQRVPLKIDEGIYAEKNTSTQTKISILRKLFILYNADPMDLVFYLRDTELDRASDESRHELRRRYWEYALPIIQKANLMTGAFGRDHAGNSNTMSGNFGVSGFYVNCVANFICARVDFLISLGDKQRNKEAFDILSEHRSDIDEKLDGLVQWDRADDNDISVIIVKLEDVSIANEADWSRMASFQAQWSSRIIDVMIPYLSEYMQDSDDPEKLERNRQMEKIAGHLREWAVEREDVHVDLRKCSKTYTRFTTDAMSALLPDASGCPSGWNTDNHYYYEIVNRDGKRFFVQFVLSAKNMPKEQKALSERINEIYPAKQQKEDWIWRMHFRTPYLPIKDPDSKEEIYTVMDEALKQIKDFEKDLTEKLRK